MRFPRLITTALVVYLDIATATSNLTPQDQRQSPLLGLVATSHNLSFPLFAELEQLSRVVDISYCVGLTSLSIAKPFQCLSRCSDFPHFELIKTWNTGPLLSDSCGYVALDHGERRILVAFRGTYSLANTIVDLSTIPQEYVPYPGQDGDEDGVTKCEGDEPKCNNCAVHSGFHSSWINTRAVILPSLKEQIALYPAYSLHLVGHSLGGAVAALAGLDFLARGWDPTITTFGEPRIGNLALAHYLDVRFDLLDNNNNNNKAGRDEDLKYRRITHTSDPVPLLPLTEWGFAMHAGEIHISKLPLSPDLQDLHHCTGDNDPTCIAGQDTTLLASVEEEIYDITREPWGIPSRYKLWELFFAHRDYFWRLGLCVPGGDPLGGGEGGEHYEQPDDL